MKLATPKASRPRQGDTSPASRHKADGGVESLNDVVGVPRFLSGDQTRLAAGSPPSERKADAQSHASHAGAPAIQTQPSGGAAADGLFPAGFDAELREMSTAVGIPPASVALVDAPGLSGTSLGRAATAATGSGPTSGAAILLDSARVPATAGGRRALFAHELAHVGQTRLFGTGRAAAPPDAVEGEARGIAEFARGSPAAAPPPVLAANPSAVWGEQGAAHVDLGAMVQITHTAPPPVTSHTTVDMTWNGDPFVLTLECEGDRMSATIRYTGRDITSMPSGYWSTRVGTNLASGAQTLPRGDVASAPSEGLLLRPEQRFSSDGLARIDPAVTVDVPRVNQAGASQVVMQLGTGLPDIVLYDDLESVETWTPALHQHSFTLHVTGVGPVAGGERAFSVRRSDALPATVAAQIAAPMPDTLHTSTASTRSLLDSAASELGAAIAAPDLDLAGTAPAEILRREIERRRALPGTAGSGASPMRPEDTQLRQGAADLLLALSEATPRLRFLHALSDPQGFLGGPDIGRRAAAHVGATRASIAAYIFLALDGNRALTSGARAHALADFARLPFQIADLYLQSGGGLEQVEQHQRDLAFDLMLTRGHTFSGLRPIDALLGVAPDTARVEAADVLHRRINALRAGLERGDPQVLTQLLDITIDAQRKAGLLAIRAAQDQFAYFAEQLDTVIDDALGVVGGGARGTTARGYRDRFDRLLTGIESALPQVNPARVDTAIAGFNAIVTAPQFARDVQAIQDRLRHIEVVRIIGRIVAITAVAALGGAAIGSVAGAGLSTAARAFALGSRAQFILVEGGSLVAEAGAFTFLSRTGEAILIGQPQRSFSADFAINLATLGLLRGVGRVYGAWRPAFRATSPRLFAAGGVASGATGAHVFGELVHVLETGHAMGGEDRAIALAQNIALVGVLHLGRYFTQPLEARLTRRVSSLLGSDRIFRGQLAQLEAQRAAVVRDAMVLGSRADASPAEVARVLAEADAHFRAELNLLRDAARFHSLPPGELQVAVASHVRALATLELHFAQEGALSPLSSAATFRSAAPGVVEFSADPASRAFLEAYYAAQGGTLTAEGERLVGELDGRRIQYIPRVDVAAAPGAGPARTEHAASLEGALQDLAGQVDVRENGSLHGRSARVRRIGGRVTIEVGPDATASEVEAHLGDARAQLRFSGPAGRLRAVQDRLLSLARVRPGTGTLGSEAAREIVKLQEMRERLLGINRSVERGRNTTEEAQAAERLADVERQLEYYERLVGSYERGRGYVAAFDTTPAAVADLRTRFPADRVAADGERLIFNGTLEVPREALEHLDQRLGGVKRASGLEEVAELSRALREVGGDESRLPDHLQQRLAVLRGQSPNVAVRPAAIPTRSASDPLLPPEGATLTTRTEAATARAARLTRASANPIDGLLATSLVGRLAALSERARAARSPGERATIETELQSAIGELRGLEDRNADAIALQQATETAATVEHVATDVPDPGQRRLGPEELARLASLRGTLDTMRNDPAYRDRVEIDSIVAELAALQAQVESQRATDIARGEREGMAALADRERALYADRDLTISAHDARRLGIPSGRYNPPDLEKLTSTQLTALADVVGQSGRDPRYVEDLRERAAKAAHRERLRTAQSASGDVDTLVAAALGGTTDLFARSLTDAEAVVARLRVLLQPGPRNEPPTFHGPESHRGIGTAPDAPHINAEGYFQGRHVDVHVYYSR